MTYLTREVRTTAHLNLRFTMADVATIERMAALKRSASEIARELNLHLPQGVPFYSGGEILAMCERNRIMVRRHQ